MLGGIDIDALTGENDDHIDHVVLRPRAPFRLDLTAWALRRRKRNQIDRWDGTYRRALLAGDRAVTVEIEQCGGPDDPCLIIRSLTGGFRSAEERHSIETQLVRMLGTNIDLGGFYALADVDALVGPLADRLRGVKPPRFPSLFEALVNAIANQQLSLEVGIELLNRITERFGEHPADGHGLIAFPEPAAVLGGSIHDLRELGFSMRKAEYVMDCAHAVLTGAIDEATLEVAHRASGDRALVGGVRRAAGSWQHRRVSGRRCRGPQQTPAVLCAPDTAGSQTDPDADGALGALRRDDVLPHAARRAGRAGRHPPVRTGWIGGNRAPSQSVNSFRPARQWSSLEY